MSAPPSGPKADPSTLVPVGDKEIVIRLIPPSAFKHETEDGQPVPDEQRVQKAIVLSNQFNGSDYGPSLFVKSLLPNGFHDIRAYGHPKWKDFGFCEVEAICIKQVGYDVRLTPSDCKFPELASAHASIIGDTTNIEELRDVFKPRVVEAPTKQVAKKA